MARPSLPGYRGVMSQDRPSLAILFICAGILAISVNDLLIKYLSADYPLHQLVFVRSMLGLILTFAFLQMEGGLKLLQTDRPGLHVLRALMIVGANMTFFAAVAALPLGQATALFFVAPLIITLLSIPVLGEKVGPLRLSAVVVGFAGVLIMQRPWEASLEVSRMVLLLPVIAAALYAGMQILTRRLGAQTAASAMSVYIQGAFLIVGAGFFIVAGDGRFAEGLDGASLQFLLRAWSWPDAQDWPLFIGIGLCSGVIGYCLSAAYKLANAATIAPFEYLGLPLAFFWGWAIFGEVPLATTLAGCALIIGAGLFVFFRERQKARPMPGWRRRWSRR
jgi:S-adenosylmethionine uptake transporter